MSAVCSGAKLQCSFGVGPSILVIPPRLLVIGKNKTPAATIIDNRPLVNIPPFLSCSAPDSPTQPDCIPEFLIPWLSVVPGIRLSLIPMLDDSAVLMCTYGGQVSITDPGQDVAKFSLESLVSASSPPESESS